jgi:hypothetical protein
MKMRSRAPDRRTTPRCRGNQTVRPKNADPMARDPPQTWAGTYGKPRKSLTIRLKFKVHLGALVDYTLFPECRTVLS